jgi:hypothetical protein
LSPANNTCATISNVHILAKGTKRGMCWLVPSNVRQEGDNACRNHQEREDGGESKTDSAHALVVLSTEIAIKTRQLTRHVLHSRPLCVLCRTIVSKDAFQVAQTNHSKNESASLKMALCKSSRDVTCVVLHVYSQHVLQVRVLTEPGIQLFPKKRQSTGQSLDSCHCMDIIPSCYCMFPSCYCML